MEYMCQELFQSTLCIPDRLLLPCDPKHHFEELVECHLTVLVVGMLLREKIAVARDLTIRGHTFLVAEQGIEHLHLLQRVVDMVQRHRQVHRPDHVPLDLVVRIGRNKVVKDLPQVSVNVLSVKKSPYGLASEFQECLLRLLSHSKGFEKILQEIFKSTAHSSIQLQSSSSNDGLHEIIESHDVLGVVRVLRADVISCILVQNRHPLIPLDPDPIKHGHRHLRPRIPHRYLALLEEPPEPFELQLLFAGLCVMPVELHLHQIVVLRAHRLVEIVCVVLVDQVEEGKVLVDDPPQLHLLGLRVCFSVCQVTQEPGVVYQLLKHRAQPVPWRLLGGLHLPLHLPLLGFEHQTFIPLVGFGPFDMAIPV
mmetsp:Transcript_4051/g.14996  ORF Transcript_4051/g.14996 Transcript_4051/m.14996 type:complete len:366 (+) Transcript_4051:606-1703(+)